MSKYRYLISSFKLILNYGLVLVNVTLAYGSQDENRYPSQQLNDNAPAAVEDKITVAEGSDQIVLNVLSNDDFGSDGPTAGPITIIFNPVVGVASVNDNQTPNDPTDDVIHYQPNEEFYGTDAIIYQICDAKGDCAQGTVSITVTPINDLPVANSDSVFIEENSERNKVYVLANDDFGGDGAALVSYSIVLDPINGTAQFNDNDTDQTVLDDYLEYTPETNYYGTEFVFYEICDENGDCSEARVIIIIEEKDFMPIALGDTVRLDENSDQVSISILQNDSFGKDLASSGLIIIVKQPQKGYARVNDNNTPLDPTDDTIAYEPYLDARGEDSLTYQICDSDNDCVTAMVKITIDPINIGNQNCLVPLKGFSPNGDGINDCWQIECIVNYPNNKVKILNRWGDVVWQTTQYINVQNAWEGYANTGLFVNTSNGLPAGTYFYLIDLGNGSEPKSGFLELKR